MRPWIRKLGVALLVVVPILLLYSNLFPLRVGALLVVISQLVALLLARGKRVKTGINLLLVVSVVYLGLVFLMIRRGPFVSAASPSPDGATTAEIFEQTAWIDRNFQVRLKTYWLGLIPRHRVIFRSPDEGDPPSERLLWSKDGRYLLLVGKQVSPTNRECLSSGEYLYLLYDGQSNLVTANTNVPALEGVSFRLGFTLADLAGMDFGEPLVPGVKCVPPA
jgi:hypothetical protein